MDITRSVILRADDIASAIRLIRGRRVLLDEDLARLYGVETKALNQSVRRNAARFPGDFAFTLTVEEAAGLRSQTVTSNGRGGRRWLPHAFTEQGVAMLSSVLKSPRAIGVNVEIIRAFVKLRRVMATTGGLARKIEALEVKYDGQFAEVFEAIRQLALPPEPPGRRIGYKLRAGG